MKRSSVEFLAVIGLCAGLLSGCISGSASSAGRGGGNGPLASLSPKLGLTFPPQGVGTTSAPEPVTLANNGSDTLDITSIAISGTNAGAFAIESNACGASLSPSAACIINITFTQATAGTLTASLTITSNASNSPQAIQLIGGAGVCAGAPTPQMQTDVTSQLSFHAAGVTVMQITNNSCNRFYYFDALAFSSTVNKIVYTNFVTNSGNTIMSANPDGTSALMRMSDTGAQPFISPDGSLLYYDKPIISGVQGGEDIFGGFLSNFQEFRITNLDVPPESPLPVWEISPSSSDPAGGNDIAFSPDISLHLVHVLTNGTSQPGTSQFPSTLTLNDPESANTFHRLRMNPKFPNIVMYKRNASSLGTEATPEVWLVDLNTCAAGVCSSNNITNLVANLPGTQSPKADHMIWSPNGLDIAFLEPDIGDYWIARNIVKVSNSIATINTGFTLQELGPFSGMTANFCVFPHDWPTATVLACMSGPGSLFNPEISFLMSTDGNGTTKLLAASDALVLTINGTPMPQFAQDDQHLMFNSDRTGSVELYVISGFTLTVP